ncbi:MAG: (2Fe-2S)-binding protein [Rhodobacteraceae bacterium]|nr:(2Fe-2S)-binding protein [Paracoccaceae bacterium]
MTQIEPSSSSPLFRLPPDRQPEVPVDVDGDRLLALKGETVAALLLRGFGPDLYRRDPRSGAARAPLCLMGVCFECLVTIDGLENQQACLVAVRPGMQVRRQLAGRETP